MELCNKRSRWENHDDHLHNGVDDDDEEEEEGDGDDFDDDFDDDVGKKSLVFNTNDFQSPL